jgi:hypothetical protein
LHWETLFLVIFTSCKVDCIPCALGTSQPLGHPHLGATYCFYYKIASSAIRAAENLTCLNNSLINHWIFLKVCILVLLGPTHFLAKFDHDEILVVDFLAVIH